MKKALLVVSFGTSYEETRIKNIESCEQRLQAAFPQRDFFRAFTSEIIRSKIAKRDHLEIDNVALALSKIHAAGYEDIAIQSLHIINGDEYEKIISAVTDFQNKCQNSCQKSLQKPFKKIAIGKPLLTHFDDYDRLIEALKAQIPPLQENERVVFMGHGAAHYAFSAYACLDHLLMHQNLPLLVGAVESYPEIHYLIDRLVAQKVEKVHLMPLMMVAGDHAINDMASDHSDSWKVHIQNAGIQTQCWLQGLGENSHIQALFVTHLLAATGETPILIENGKGEFV